MTFSSAPARIVCPVLHDLRKAQMDNATILSIHNTDIRKKDVVIGDLKDEVASVRRQRASSRNKAFYWWVYTS